MKQQSQLNNSNSDGNTPSVDEGATVSALARGVQILQCFSTSKPELTATELIAITSIPKPTFHRLAATLCTSGLLRYSEHTGRFVPAPGLLTLASPLLARTTIRQLAFGQMQALADHVSGQVSLALGAGLALVFVELAQAANCTTFRPALGGHISLSRTATGRAYLAALPDALAQQVVDSVQSADPTQGALLVQRLADARNELAERGFCTSHGDLQRQLEAVAVPIRAASSEEIYVFNAVVPVFKLAPGQLQDDVGPRLVVLARSVEAALGHSPSAEQQWP